MINNIYAAWIGMLLGCLAGMIPGLFFYQKDWLGGYGSWSRRMVRLAHISFFGLAFINLAFSFTISTLNIENGIAIPSVLLIIAAITMPLVCYSAVVKSFLRHLFFIPAMSATVGIAFFLWRIFTP